MKHFLFKRIESFCYFVMPSEGNTKKEGELFSGLERYGCNFQKKVVLLFFTLISSLLLLSSGIADIFFFNQYINGGAKFLFFLLFMGNYGFLYLHKDPDKTAIASLLLFFLLLFASLYMANMIRGGVMWFISLPVLVFSLRPLLQSMIWVGIFLFVLVISLFLDYHGVYVYHISSFVEVRSMLLVFTGVAILNFLTSILKDYCLFEVSTQKNEVQNVLHKSQIDLAVKIQHSLIPDNDVNEKEYEISFYYKAAYLVGGDYIDYFTISDDRIGVVMCDVVGKGVPAALLMVSVRTVIKNLIESGITDPAKIMELLNSMFRSDYGEDFFVTFAFLLYDKSERVMRFYNAGHSPFIYFSHVENRMREIEVEGYPIGMFDDLGRGEYISVKLFPGDIVVLFSDGLTDLVDSRNFRSARNRIFSEIQRNSAMSAPDLKNILINRFINSERGERENCIKDDISLVIFKVTDYES